MKREHEIGFTIKTLHNMIMRSEVRNMRSMGVDDLNFTNGWILGYLYRNRDREIYQKDIEAHFSIARSTVTGMVKQLEKSGYLTRRGVERDSRLKCLILTRRGEECHKKIHENFRRVERQMSKGIGQDDLKVFFKVCSQIRSNLCEDSGEKYCHRGF